MNIVWKGSPNYDSNRKPIDRIVIHWMSGTLAGTDAQFQKSGGTSAHYGIEDNVIHQYVKEDNVAYHAGVYTMNQRSIGIEHSANIDRPASEETYKSSGMLVADLCKRYSIPLDRNHIIKHSEVPRSTACPGTLNLDKIIQIAKGNTMSDDETVVKKEYLAQLEEAKSYLQQFKDKGFFSATEVSQQIDDLNKAIGDKNTEIKAEKDRAESFRKDFNDLLAYAAKAVNTQQELNQVHTGLDNVEKNLTEYDDLQRAFATLQLSSGKSEEELKAEIAKLRALLKQENVLENVELADLLKELVRRLLSIIKRK